MRPIAILYIKLVEALELAKLKDISRWLKRFILAVLLSLFLVDMGQDFWMIRSVCAWHNGIIPRVSIAFLVVYGFDYMLPLWNLRFRLISAIKKQDEGGKIAGINLEELTDFIWSGNSLSRSDLMNRYAISRGRADRILSLLDSAQILERGKNNARVVSGGANRADVFTALSPLLEDSE